MDMAMEVEVILMANTIIVMVVETFCMIVTMQ